MPRFDTALFDLDGTLLDTLEDLSRAINHALCGNGYPARSVEEVRRFVGNGVAMLALRAMPDCARDDADAARRVLEDFKSYYAAHNNVFTKPYEGITEMLRALGESGMRIAAVSNKNDVNVRALCDEYFGGLLDGAMGEREGVSRKPAPDMPLMMLDALGGTPQRAVYIGDSGVDIETARNAGMCAAIVGWGFWDAARLRDAGAERVFTSARELQDWLLSPCNPE